jgi:hypothetical protein
MLAFCFCPPSTQGDSSFCVLGIAKLLPCMVSVNSQIPQVVPPNNAGMRRFRPSFAQAWTVTLENPC